MMWADTEGEPSTSGKNIQVNTNNNYYPRKQNKTKGDISEERFEKREKREEERRKERKLAEQTQRTNSTQQATRTSIATI